MVISFASFSIYFPAHRQLESWNGIYLYQAPISLKIDPNHPDGFTGSHLTGLDPGELSKDHLRLIKTADKRIEDKENPRSFFC